MTTEHWTDELRNVYAVNYANGILRRTLGMRRRLSRSTSGPVVLGQGGARRGDEEERPAEAAPAQAPDRLRRRSEGARQRARHPRLRPRPIGRDADDRTCRSRAPDPGQRRLRRRAARSAMPRVVAVRGASIAASRSPPTAPPSMRWRRNGRSSTRTAEGATLFQSFAWCRAVFDHHERSGQAFAPLVVTLRERGRLVGAAAAAAVEAPAWRGSPPASASPTSNIPTCCSRPTRRRTPRRGSSTPPAGCRKSTA